MHTIFTVYRRANEIVRAQFLCWYFLHCSLTTGTNNNNKMWKTWIILSTRTTHFTYFKLRSRKLFCDCFFFTCARTCCHYFRYFFFLIISAYSNVFRIFNQEAKNVLHHLFIGILRAAFNRIKHSSQMDWRVKNAEFL